MVTAGVYLLMRTSPLIEYSSTVLILCLWLGAITTVFSSLIGLFQQDIKKVIAYSTMSQLAREYYFKIFRHQTICVEIIHIIHSQITKALNYYYNYINVSFFNSFFAIYILRQYLFRLNPILMSEKWEAIIISKLVGISEAIRLILIFFKFIVNLKAKTFFFFIKYSLNIFNIILIFIYFNIFFYTISRVFLLNKPDQACRKIFTTSCQINTSIDNLEKTRKAMDLKFKQWLAGLLDGDGHFILTKKGYASCEITMDMPDKKALFEIKQKYGGSIKSLSNANAVRYKLRHKKGLILLLNDVNGHLRNPTRLLQMNKLCIKYNIELVYPKPLTFNNGWLSGFIDSDGSVYFNEASGQVFIGITQKNKYLLDPLINIYSGRIDILSPKIDAFKYLVYRKIELFNLIDNYFNIYPLKTSKMNRINLIKEFYKCRVSKNNKDINKLKDWISFKDKWEKFQD